MSHRERPNPDEAPARQASRPLPTGGFETVAQSEAAPSLSCNPSLWAEWYERASSAQQQTALLRAVQQGVLYAHQLDPPARAATPQRSFVNRLLNGHAKELEPLYPPALDYHDCQLDGRQREAVARAVATPDVCLIQGFPGTGKSRVVTEIIRQAVERRQRILFLATTTAALDGVLEPLSTESTVCAIRCLADDEQPASLPPVIARLTLPERLRSYQETTLPAARAARAAALQTLEARAREQEQWTRLEELAAQYERLAQQLQCLSERRKAVAEEVEHLGNSSADSDERWQSCQRRQQEALERVDCQLASLQVELDTNLSKQAQLENEWEAIRPLEEARRSGRFWTRSWWRAMKRSRLKEQVCSLECRRAELRDAHERLQQALAERRSERADIEKQCADDFRRWQDEEIARRSAAVDTEIAAATRAQADLRHQWQSSIPSLAVDALPSEISPQALREGLASWKRLREQDAQHAAAAEQWLQTVEEGLPTLPEKIACCANVIAATTSMFLRGMLGSDTGGMPTFDLLILEETHRIAKSEFTVAARQARRWVLLGEPQVEAGPADRTAGNGQATKARFSFFHRLWHNLHANPYRLPFRWKTHGGRLICRLRPYSAEHERWIETEPVVDRPDIELRILSLPRQLPQVVEILFPACMDLAEAKQFIFRELEELAVQTNGQAPCWSETVEEIILELAPVPETECASVALGNGVQERLTCLPPNRGSARDSGTHWHTSALAFTRAAGWTRERAEAWIADRIGFRSTGRTILLTVPDRHDRSGVQPLAFRVQERSSV